MPTQLALEQAKARSQDSIRGSPIGSQNPNTWLSSATLLGTLTGSCIGSKELGLRLAFPNGMQALQHLPLLLIFVPQMPALTEPGAKDPILVTGVGGKDPTT